MGPGLPRWQGGAIGAFQLKADNVLSQGRLAGDDDVPQLRLRRPGRRRFVQRVLGQVNPNRQF